MYYAIVRLVGIASIVACMIVIASFGLFVINQTSTASMHQEQALASPGGNAGESGSPPAPRPKEGTVRRSIDEASEWLTSPFAGLTSGSGSQWTIRGVGLLLALLVYGFGAGFVARSLRVRS